MASCIVKLAGDEEELEEEEESGVEKKKVAVGKRPRGRPKKGESSTSGGSKQNKIDVLWGKIENKEVETNEEERRKAKEKQNELQGAVAFAPGKTLARTPEKGGKEHESEENKEDGKRPDGRKEEETQEETEKSELNQDEGDTSSEASTDGERMDRLSEWMEKWERKQEEKWTERMTDLERLIREEVGRSVQKSEAMKTLKNEREAWEEEAHSCAEKVVELKRMLQSKEEAIQELAKNRDYWKEQAIRGRTESEVNRGDNEGERQEKGEDGQSRTHAEGLMLLEKHKKEELEEWIKHTLGIRCRVERLGRIAPAKWNVRVEDMGQKKDLMREKGRLDELGWGVLITDDYTERQKEVQNWLKEEAIRWERKGKTARAAYNKLLVDGTWLGFNEKEGELELRKESQEEREQGEGPF